MVGNVATRMDKQISYVQVEKIKPNPNQPRKTFVDDNLQELASSIKEHGVLQPITIRFDGITHELIAGERRLRACKLAGVGYIPCIVINVDSEKSSVLAIIENLQRENLNYIEEALGFKSLIKDYGYTQEELAKKIGKTQSTIANKIRILKLEDEIQEVLLSNNLTERHGRALLKLNKTSEQRAILDSVVEKGLNVNETEKLIDTYLGLNTQLNTELTVRSKRKSQKIKMAIRDVRIFLNTINHAVEVMKNSGINANHEIIEVEDGYKVTINIMSNKNTA